jgi:hypothetical protein
MADILQEAYIYGEDFRLWWQIWSRFSFEFPSALHGNIAMVVVPAQ